MSDTARTTTDVQYAYSLTTYRREPDVQAVLERWDRLSARLPLREWDDPSTPLEALVTAARALSKAGQSAQAWAVVEAIVRRVTSRTYRHLAVWGVVGTNRHEDVTRDIVHMTVECVLSTGPQNEFWECRFWTCFDRRVRTILRDMNRGRQSETTLDDDFDIVDNHADWTDNVAAQALLDRLPEPVRTAFYLKHYAGYKEESAEPEPTISTLLGVSGRTVRNYLTKAEKLLSEWRNEDERSEAGA